MQYYYNWSNGYRKTTSPVLLAKVFSKSRRTIAREIKRGLVIHARSNPPFEVERYNAEHAQLDAEAKMTAKGLEAEEEGGKGTGSPGIRMPNMPQEAGRHKRQAQRRPLGGGYRI